MNIDELIQRTAESTARATVAEMKRVGLTKDNRLGSFKKTERVLYEYSDWINAKDASETTRRFCELVRHALDRIKDDPYYEIIELKYFNHWTHEKIAERLDVDVSVISKRRMKLINQLRPLIFSDDFIRELFEL